ncbi:MAG: hypothetical protein D6715_12710 [Calditrichaeota bacterium]|nr:MAG: hypothetical protein D6715_12710 [Calditrichota bacterium]
MDRLTHIRTAMILAAGLGTRMGELTADRPKVLLPLNGVTLLEVLVRQLQKAGIERVVINAHYRRDVLRRFVAERNWQGISIFLSEEAQLLDTGGGVAFAEKFFDGRTVLVVNGDVLSDLSLPAFEAAFRRSGALAAMAVVPCRDSRKYSLVHYSEEGTLLGFLPRGQKPPPDALTGIFTGFQLLTPRARAYLSPKPESIIRALYLKALEEGRRIFIFPHTGRWLDLGTRERYLRIRNKIQQGKIRLEDFC